MLWLDVVAVLVSAVLVNYLGLIYAIEKVIRHKLPVLNCPKCLSFWSLLCLFVYKLSFQHLTIIVAASLLGAYLSEWIELCFGIFDKFYENLYNKIFPTETGTETDSNTTYTETTEADMPKVWQLTD